MFNLIPIENDIEKVYIICNNVKIGRLNYYHTMNDIIINYIEIFDEYKRHGFATKFISYLQDIHHGKTLHGDALPSAIKFWESLNVEFYEPFPSKLRPDVLLTPFKLKL